MGFPIGYLCSIWSNLLASAQTCQLFENELVATLKRSKETNYDFLARIWSAGHFNFKLYSIEREVIWKNTILTKKMYENGNQNFQFYTGFHFLAYRSKHLMENETFSREVFV